MRSIVVVLLGLLPQIGLADPLPGSPLEGVACSSCHLVSDARGQVPAAEAALLVDSQELLCVSCHQQAIETGHPSGFQPERELSPEFPLDFSGYLSCSSCHLIHEPAHGSPRRAGPVSETCNFCHEY